MTELSPAQISSFWENGYVVAQDAVDAALLAAMQSDFAAWIEESREHDAPYGDTLDGRPRFDLAAEHGPQTPALRRVNAPIEVSDAFYRATVDSTMTDFIAQLIGPDVKLHHTKINSKLPGAGTEVKWHQDFTFTPHSNDDVVTALLMVDDVTEDNGPLQVLPGSHRGELHSLWHDGVFTGSIDDDIAASCAERAELCIGPAGAVCMMHTRLLHGSTANRSRDPRTLHLAVYSAEDAVPCSPNPMPTRFEGLMVRGQRSGRIRSIVYDMELPQLPTTASFFDQQAKHDGT
jgi:ectoine hydroxylase-related dioxygenase (phytanoyl-CoA dioxygenase family)